MAIETRIIKKIESMERDLCRFCAKCSHNDTRDDCDFRKCPIDAMQSLLMRNLSEFKKLEY